MCDPNKVTCNIVEFINLSLTNIVLPNYFPIHLVTLEETNKVIKIFLDLVFSSTCENRKYTIAFDIILFVLKSFFSCTS